MALAAGLLGLVVLLSAWPLARLLALAFSPGDAGEFLGTLRDGWQSRAVQRAAANTLTASLGATAIATVSGTGLALLLGLGRFRGHTAASFLVLSPLLVPSQIMALAWIELFGLAWPGGGRPLYGGAGIAFLLGLESMPLVFLAVRASLALLPGDLVEAARICGVSRRRTVARIVLPLLVPAAAGGAALAFAASIGNFGIPALLGIPGRFPMLTTLVYQRLNGFGPSVLAGVAVIALILVALTLAALLLRFAVLRTLAVPVERTSAPFAGVFGPAPRPVAEAIVWSFALLVAVVPMGALLVGSLAPALGVAPTLGTLSGDNYAAIWASPAIRRALVNSAALGAAMALLCGALALPLAYLARLRRLPAARLAGTIAEIPFAVPGTVLALALILVFLPPLPVLRISLYATPAILLLAYVVRFLPLVLAPVSSALSTLDPALDDAGRVSGVSVWRRLAFIAAPLAAPATAAGMLVAALTAFNELTVSVLLWSAGTETVGVMVFSLQYEGNSGQAAALSVVSIGVVLALALMFDRLGRRTPAVVPWRG
ncbi:ABC transporter permease subunit [Aureimonas sp. ME7]|uniref:ABC transporter permease n=1 Tax=Aureimonas sp. ME7 TaxID=2744252 RepID=UPI0015F714BD|nr:ABC transporter permease subunit [Aureimonas sp. ME7]